MSALTGVPIALDWAKSLLYPLTGSMKRLLPKPMPGTTQSFAGFTAAGRQLEQLWPGARETDIPLPKDGAVAAYAIAAASPHPYARSYAYLNSADVSVLRATPYSLAVRGFRLYHSLMSFHTGIIGGWFVQLLLGMAAACVPVLAWTGCNSYLHRRLHHP